MYSYESKPSLNSTTYDQAGRSFIFELELEDASTINKVLSEVSDPDDSSILIVTADGLRIVATGDRTSQVSAFFSASTFKKFLFNPEDPVKFRFVLKEFIECLSLLQEDLKDEDKDPRGPQLKTSLRINYAKKGDPLRLRLENNTNYSVKCDLKEFSLPSVNTLMAFAGHEEVTEITFFSKELYKFVSGLDLTSTFIKLRLEPGPVPVRLRTESPKMGEVELEIRYNDEPEIIKKELNVPHNMVFNFSYRTQFIKPALEALRTSNSMQMKCGSSGLLLMEHFHGSPPLVQSVEYYVLCEAIS